MKLFPIVSIMFAHAYTSEVVYDMYVQFCDDVMNNDFKLLDLMHHYTSGMKSVFTQECWDSLILIRQSLGGAGYSAWSAIPHLIENYSPSTTFEGDNTVMAQQSFNYLMKLASKVTKGKTKAEGVFSYINEIESLVSQSCQATSFSHFLDIENVELALKVNVAMKLKLVMK